MFPATLARLVDIPNGRVLENAPLSEYTRFAIGGPADILFDAKDEAAFVCALEAVIEAQTPHVVIGGGTNLVVADAGFAGVVLRYSGGTIGGRECLLEAEAGAVLQDVVDRSITLGLGGLQTMTGIPGYLGGAVYGNAGAYGHSIAELIRCVSVFDGEHVVKMTNEDCQFRYRTSIFKQRKSWIILSAKLEFRASDTDELRKTASEIRAVRDVKYPPSMKCAGSIFKNLLLVELPASAAAQVPPGVIREGKVPSAWFLEQAGARGMRRGDIQVADYHANLIYNDGAGTAEDLVAVIREVKSRVQDRFGFELEEEVQYVGFNG